MRTCFWSARRCAALPESLTLDGLGILTTTPIPVASQGLLPVTNLRYPALFIPTGEAVLIEGSLIQLGDQTVHRVAETKIQLEGPPTSVLKVTVFRDEWGTNWDQFIQSPVKAILQKFPAFVLCKGVNCGDGCAKFHLPVDADVELGSVIADVWNRIWLSHRGKKVQPADADLFQVYFRVPAVCLPTLHWQSGHGLYVEPRTTDGRATDS